MWFKTLKLFAVPALLILWLGGCGLFRTYIYDPSPAPEDSEEAPSDTGEVADTEPDRQSPPDEAVEESSPTPKKEMNYVKPGVMIAPVQGTPGMMGRLLSARITDELMSRQVRASSRSQGKVTYILEGKAFLNPGEQGRTDFRIDWNLSAPDGLSAGRFSDRVPVNGAGWDAITAAVMDPMARRAAAQVDIMLQEHVQAPEAIPIPQVESQLLQQSMLELRVVRTLTPVFVDYISGAPGDGRLSLRDALSKALSKARVPVAPTFNDQTYLVMGDVHVTPIDSARNKFDITWVVLRSNGETIGVVDNTMSVGVSRVIPAWGSVAEQAVDEVIGDIVVLIDQASKQDRKAATGS